MEIANTNNQNKSYSFNLNSISVENERNLRSNANENGRKVDYFIRKAASHNLNKPNIIPDAKIPMTSDLS